MLLPPSASPALELSPLIWLVQLPTKSPEVSQWGSQRSKNKSTDYDTKIYSISMKTITANCWSHKSSFLSTGRECFPWWFSCTEMLISPGKGEKKDSPTISELRYQNKEPIQWAAKTICSNGLYVLTLQQLKHLPKSLGQPPIQFQCALWNKQAHSQRPRYKVQGRQAATKKLFDTCMKIWMIALYHNSEFARLLNIHFKMWQLI